MRIFMTIFLIITASLSTFNAQGLLPKKSTFCNHVIPALIGITTGATARLSLELFKKIFGSGAFLPSLLSVSIGPVALAGWIAILAYRNSPWLGRLYRQEYKENPQNGSDSASFGIMSQYNRPITIGFISTVSTFLLSFRYYSW